MSRKLLGLLALVMVLSIGFGPVAAQDDGPGMVGPADPDLPTGGTIIVNESPRGSFVSNFNPYSPDPMHGTTRILYEPLVVFNPVDGGAPTPWLATGASYSDDLMSLTVNLREGVQWSDGEDFNADDVVFTFQLFQDFPALDRRAVWTFLESVEKIDDYTVQFNLSEVYTQADTLIGRTLIVPQHVWSQIEDPVTFTNDDPVTTGPFSEVEFTDQVYTFCRNEFYWQEGKPYADCIRYPLYTGNDSANLALINGELDWAGNFVPDIEQTYVAQNPETNHYYFWGGGGPWSLGLNVQVAPFDDVKVRHALSLLVPFEVIRDTAMNGYTTVVQENATGIYPRYADWVSEDVLATVEEMGLGVYDADRAASILDENGYVDADGDGWRDLKDGSAWNFEIQIVNGWTDVVTAAQIISQSFQDAGVNANVVTPEFGEWQSKLQQGTYEASLHWTNWDRTPYEFFRNIMYSGLIDENGVATGQFMSFWTSEETDALLDAFVATADPEEQREIVADLNMAMVENVLLTPLSPWPTWYEYSTARFEGWPTEENYYAQGSPWQDDSARIVAINVYCKDDTSCGQGE